MSGDTSNKDMAEEKTSFIVVEFQAPGSVVFKTQINGVTPYQILAIAAYFETYAKREILQTMSSQEENRAEAPKIVVPNKW